MKNLFLTVLCLTTTIFAANEKKAEAKVKAIVNATSLNVRVKKSTESEVLCSLSKGAEVTVIAVNDDWAKIVIPKQARVWLESKNQKDGIITKDATLYAGPAVLYSPIGKITKGAKIKKIRGSAKWFQIEPPKQLFAWVGSKFLTFPEIKVVKKSDDKKAPVERVITEEKNLENEVKEVKKDKIIATLKPGDKEFYFNQKQTNDKGLQLVTGTVTKLKAEVKDLATHALVIKVDDNYQTICYLRSKAFKLDEWQGKNVAIKGNVEQIAGWRRPIIIVDSLKEILEAPSIKLKK